MLEIPTIDHQSFISLPLLSNRVLVQCRQSTIPSSHSNRSEMEVRSIFIPILQPSTTHTLILTYGLYPSFIAKLQSHSLLFIAKPQPPSLLPSPAQEHPQSEGGEWFHSRPQCGTHHLSSTQQLHWGSPWSHNLETNWDLRHETKLP